MSSCDIHVKDINYVGRDRLGWNFKNHQIFVGLNWISIKWVKIRYIEK